MDDDLPDRFRKCLISFLLQEKLNNQEILALVPNEICFMMACAGPEIRNEMFEVFQRMSKRLYKANKDSVDRAIKAHESSKR